MPKLLQINITANWGSHGKIAEGIGRLALQQGWESHIAYGRYANPSQSQLYHIGNMADEYWHVAETRLFDRHGLGSKRVTRQLVDYIRRLAPDVIHLHNIHGYYLNYPLLFRYLEEAGVPVVWTLHDCWAFTGHCAHYMSTGCTLWQTACHHCQLTHSYPKSLWADRSARNFEDKKRAFLSVRKMTIVPVSHWLEQEVRLSFLQQRPIRQIYNGINVALFSPQGDSAAVLSKYGIPQDKKMVLGVASKWYQQKGIDDFGILREKLSDDYIIVLVGLNKKQAANLPVGVAGIERTNDTHELACLYSAANVFFNPTWEDNFPTTNLEALACGTPVVTYRTGGCAECINENNGFVVDQGDMDSACLHIKEICSQRKEDFQDTCRNYILSSFNEDDRYQDYINLYLSLISHQNVQRP